MAKKRTFKEKYREFKYNHLVLKWILENGWTLLVNLASALILAIGFKLFLAPSHYVDGVDVYASTKLVSGGMTGISQNVILIINMCTGDWVTKTENMYDILYGILYFGLNIPIFLLAFFGIGKRFAIYTFINVLAVSLITNFMNIPALDAFINNVAIFVNENGGLVARALFAGVTTGLSSAIAYKVDCSGGGIDVIAYYIAIKKSTLVGKYSALLNGVTVLIFTILSSIHDPANIADAWGKLCFSVLYLVVVMLVVDLINVRNKKQQIEIVTSKQDLPDYLLSVTPHGATVITGKGAYSGKEKFVIDIVVSTYEVKDIVEAARTADPQSFVKVSDLRQVYGHFFTPPVR